MKNKHRIKQGLSLLLAGGIALTNPGAALPAFAENAVATPETVQTATLDPDAAVLYADLPDAPVGSYIGSEGLPVATGQTKIGLSLWVDGQLEQDSHLDPDALNSGDETVTVPLNTPEKVDGAVITVTPSRTGGSVDGGSWQMTPAGAQTITTSGHTQDDSFHLNGGDGSATWTVHYEVSKTSTSTLSGQEGPFTSQAEADAAAEAAKNAAIGQLQNEAQGMVDAAIASARAQLANITFSYDEITIPHGFDSTPGALGSHQTITVPANSSNDYPMKNDEWSVKVSI
ncbi:hypothetical protein MR798_04320, partial [bacterium]|nr:hypothetical protein [bacterium]